LNRITEQKQKQETWLGAPPPVEKSAMCGPPHPPGPPPVEKARAT